MAKSDRSASAMTRRRRIASPYVCLVGLLVVAAAFAQVASDRLAPIAAALRDQQFEKAIEMLHPVLQQFPNDSRLWTMQGAAYSGLGKKKDALASFRTALKSAPDNILALHGAAQIEYDSGNATGIPLLQHLLRLQPDDLTSHAMLAVLEYQQGNCKSAVTQFEKAGPLFDAQSSALHAYATCLMRVKLPGKAVDVFQRALNLNPDDERERRLLASVQLLANRPEDALSTLAPLLQGSDPQSNTLELAATAYEQNKNTPEAVSALRRAILLAPKNVNLYLDFANLSYAHDSFQVGIDVVSDGINLQPDAASLYFARGVLYVQLAQYDKGEGDFEKAYQLDPTQSLSAAALGLAAAQQNDLDRALVNVEASLKKKPNDAILLYLQAEILSQKGAEPGTTEFTRALRSASKAVELQPVLAPPRVVLATLYLQSGRYKEAAEQCRRALQSDPKNQTALYHLIQALRKSGDNRELPDLLKRLALLRKEASHDQSQRYQYRLVEDDSVPK